MASFKIIDMGNVIEVYKYSAPKIREEKHELSDALKKENERIEKRWAEMVSNDGLSDELLNEWGWNTTEDEKTLQNSFKWDRSHEYRKASAHRRREVIRRSANMNFGKDCCFVTLTYAENMKDIKQGNKDFKDFIKRLKRAFYSEKYKDEQGKTRYKESEPLKYLAVAEFQQRGAVHYHILINLKGFDLSSERKIKASEKQLAKIWGHGTEVNIKKIKPQTVDNVGAYMVKYLEKGFMEIKAFGNDMYLTSRNLEKPKIIVGEDALIMVDSLAGLYPVYTNEYETFYHGTVNYKEYNLERLGVKRA